jgi:hypothetical protein
MFTIIWLVLSFKKFEFEYGKTFWQDSWYNTLIILLVSLNIDICLISFLIK